MIDWIAADWTVPDHIVAGTTLRTHAESAVPLDGVPCWLQQVHDSSVIEASHYNVPPKADGCIRGDDGLICVVRTADCLPVLLCAADGSEFAVAHAGWRGLAAGVIENTVAKLAVRPDDLLVWLGPAISQPSFEVGDEVRAAFMSHDSQADDCFDRNARGRWQADLYGLARQRLVAAGVTRISGGGFCTFLDAARFYSYRRNPKCGRMVSFVGVKTPLKTGL